MERTGEADPEVIKDFLDKKQSVFAIPNLDDPMLYKVATAFTLLLAKIEDFNFVAIDKQILDGAGFSIQRKIGNTPDDKVNELHFDIDVPTINKASQLCELYWTHGSQGSVYRNKLFDYAEQGIINEQIRINRIKLDSAASDLRRFISGALKSREQLEIWYKFKESEQV